VLANARCIRGREKKGKEWKGMKRGREKGREAEMGRRKEEWV